MSVVVKVDDNTTRAELAETLDILNFEAKRLSRQGFTVTRGAAYAKQHDRINAVLGDLLRAKH